ncbi:hypothetical protein IV454_24930 [Massilia antarctica]|uniref:Uncharacterized protein n=1 Tax=Massilia antarctica TaxID=2765360 RepID=A0AA48WCI2_9BURK|nr:hypothetical protein [Massilia antarctica]QPI48730.1 hypothetical protein IV454_24930 [Massilia antarctica]
MSISHALLSFANVLEVAELCASDPYERQSQLVAECRAMKMPFLASMPLRHRFSCPVCGLQRGEVELHFEDPRQVREMPSDQGMWGTPAGQFYQDSFSSMHAILVHGADVPIKLQTLLSGLAENV